MSTLSPQSTGQQIKADPFQELPSAAIGSSSALSAGPSTGSVSWGNTGPMLRFEDAVVETVVTHTTRTTTSFAPIPLPRIPMPDTIPQPDHLASEEYPLALQPSPEEMRVFAINIGGRRMVVQEDNALIPEGELPGVTSGPGWTRSLLGADPRTERNRIGLVQAFTSTTGKGKGKEARKRPIASSEASRSVDAPTPPNFTAEGALRPRRSPPRKKIRGLDDLTIPHDAANPMLSPLPSPEHEGIPGTSRTASSPPPVGSGLELASLFSLPSLVSSFEHLPDKIQQHVLMNLLRRSRMPTIQNIYAFAGVALKRDFISLLPHEIAVQILRRIDAPSLAAASRVCKKWRKMIDSERNVWKQRLIDEGLWYGHGVEEEEEQLMVKRAETLEWESHNRLSKAGTPTEDEPMETARSSTLPIDKAVPLKHVYRRRYCSSRNWVNNRPEHTSFPGHGTNVVTCLQFDADKIVSASDDHSINVYNTANGSLRRRLDGHEGGVWALEYKGDTLVSGSTDRTVRIWDLDTLTESHVFHGHTSTVRCLQIVEPVLDPATGEYQPPCPMIVTGSRDASLRLWKLPKKGESPLIQFDDAGEPAPVPPEDNPWHVHHMEGHTSAVRAVAAYGRTCVSGSYDTTVRVWDLVTGQCKHVLSGHEQKVYSIAYDRHRNRCASGSMDNTVKVWDVITGECLQTLIGHTSLVGLLGVSANSIVSAGADSSLRIWDANTHEHMHTLNSNGGAITCFQHDDTKVVSGSDGNLKLWDVKSGRYVRDLVVGIASVWQVAFNGNLLVAASNRGGSTMFDVFDFGKLEHQSGLDDERLDARRRPMWERRDPREPRTYQVDEIDDVEITSPRDLFTHLSVQSPDGPERHASDRSHPRASHSGSRRSSRLAAKEQASVRWKRHFKQEATSPSPLPIAGSSSGRNYRNRSTAQPSFAPDSGLSFGPDIEDEKDGMDEDVKEESF